MSIKIFISLRTTCVYHKCKNGRRNSRKEKKEKREKKVEWKRVNWFYIKTVAYSWQYRELWLRIKRKLRSWAIDFTYLSTPFTIHQFSYGKSCMICFQIPLKTLLKQCSGRIKRWHAECLINWIAAKNALYLNLKRPAQKNGTALHWHKVICIQSCKIVDRLLKLWPTHWLNSVDTRATNVAENYT